MQYDEFGMDRVENRLIKSTLLKLVKHSVSAENVKALCQLLAYFQTINASQNHTKDFYKVKLDRNMKYYENVMNWSKVFLNNKSFTTFTGQDFGESILFPMEKLFESYIGKHLKRALLVFEDWDISLQDKGYYLFEKSFALRPDIVLRNDTTQRTIIIDTKWKILINSSVKKYGISQSDMYQMYAYAKKYHTDEIWLMYPITDEFTDTEQIEFKSDDGVTVKILFVDCTDIESSITNIIKNIT